MQGFTYKRFASLPASQQHKKCAELLRTIYEKLLQQASAELDLNMYCQWREWMGLPSILSLHDLKELADEYHLHLKQAGISKREHHLLPAVRKGDQAVGQEPWPLAIYLDHIRSAHNVGSILRTTEALRLGSVYFSLNTPFCNHKQVQDTSMGAYQWIPCYQNVSISQLPKPLIVLETCEQACSLYDFIFPDTFTLVIGNEEYGCSDAVLQQADILLEIPLRGKKNSLNVANAFAIVAAEIQRQKIEKERYGQKSTI